MNSMQIYITEIEAGGAKLELSIVEENGCQVVFTARDAEDRRILKAPLLEDGKVKIYSSVEEACADLQTRFSGIRKGAQS